MELEHILSATDPEGDAEEVFRFAQQLEKRGDLDAAASAYDRAYGLAPDRDDIRSARAILLDRLSVIEHGIGFRYIPAGTFLMGSESGDPDEQPVHPVRLDAYWLSETPISWAKFCELMDFQPPPDGRPNDGWESQQSPQWIDQILQVLPVDYRHPDLWKWALNADSRICLQYCENETFRARDWHAHIPTMEWQKSDGTTQTSADMFGLPPRIDQNAPLAYGEKPIVSVPYIGALAAGLRISTKSTEYRLPTEAEWEKGARGGLINQAYPWGNEKPTHDRCDFARFDEFSLLKPKSLTPNGYGLYAMSGSVWEWTSDWYDAKYYASSPVQNPPGPKGGEERVLRGGSWTDDAEAVTVSYRMSGQYGSAANIGFRLYRGLTNTVEI